MTYQVKNRFQNLPFKFNLQRYAEEASLVDGTALSDTGVDVIFARAKVGLYTAVECS
jgi:hypothetical protein